MNNLDKLPNEILDIIFEYYWKDVFKKSLIEIKKPHMLEHKINNFIEKYCMIPNYFNDVYLNYLTILNNEISSMVKNKSLIYICSTNKLILYYCFEFKNDIVKNINNQLHYIAIYCICKSGYMRWYTWDRFLNLSKLL